MVLRNTSQQQLDCFPSINVIHGFLMSLRRYWNPFHSIFFLCSRHVLQLKLPTVQSTQSTNKGGVSCAVRQKDFVYSARCSCLCTHWDWLCWYHHHLDNNASLAPCCCWACQAIITISLWLVTVLFLTDVGLLTKASWNTATNIPSTQPAFYIDSHVQDSVWQQGMEGWSVF